MKTHWQWVKWEFLSSSFTTECHLQYEILCLIRKLKKKTNKKKKLRQSAYRLSHKTEIKVIKTAYQKKGRYLQEPMRTWVKKQPNCLKRGKTRATNWFNVCIWLVERAAQMFWTYMYQKRSKAKTMQSHNFFFSSSLRNCTM